MILVMVHLWYCEIRATKRSFSEIWDITRWLFDIATSCQRSYLLRFVRFLYNISSCLLRRLRIRHRIMWSLRIIKMFLLYVLPACHLKLVVRIHGNDRPDNHTPNIQSAFPSCTPSFLNKLVVSVLSPCEQAAKASLSCMDRNDYNRDNCMDFFQAYRDCKKAWVRDWHPYQVCETFVLTMF